MKGVDTIARIRREFFIRGRSIKEVVRDLHVSRNTVRKVLRSGSTSEPPRCVRIANREIEPSQH
jgi:orotate phosphoribosyltransferase-like protein